MTTTVAQVPLGTALHVLLMPGNTHHHLEIQVRKDGEIVLFCDTNVKICPFEEWIDIADVE